MRGPSEEQWRQLPNTNQNHHHHYNTMQYQSQVPQQSATQSTANFNGNNSRSYHSNGGRQQQNGNAGVYNSYQNAQQSPTNDDSNPFAEYTWMADAEEFDKQVMEQMEQEEYLEACFQELWQEEENDGEWYIPPQVSGDAVRNQSSNVESLNRLTLNETQVPTMLNPNAAEFIPRRAIVHQ